MELRQIGNDLFSIDKIAILQKTTGNDVYDFNFRNYFECKSIISQTDNPILLHIGAISDYRLVEKLINEMGMDLLVTTENHLKCSQIDEWYPIIKEKTPFTKIYDSVPSEETILADFKFPIFVKGNRQTNRHQKKQCIIETVADYKSLKNSWNQDPILGWQKIAIREYVLLKTVDNQSFPDMVPISYEFRFFCVNGRVVGFGPYWYFGPEYSLRVDEEETAVKLAEWAAQKIAVPFIAVDLAKTAAGEWIIIEVNDAQESGFVGANPIKLWKNTISAFNISD